MIFKKRITNTVLPHLFDFHAYLKQRMCLPLFIVRNPCKLYLFFGPSSYLKFYIFEVIYFSLGPKRPQLFKVFHKSAHLYHYNSTFFHKQHLKIMFFSISIIVVFYPKFNSQVNLIVLPFPVFTAFPVILNEQTLNHQHIKRKLTVCILSFWYLGKYLTKRLSSSITGTRYFSSFFSSSIRSSKFSCRESYLKLAYEFTRAKFISKRAHN